MHCSPDSQQACQDAQVLGPWKLVERLFPPSPTAIPIQ